MRQTELEKLIRETESDRLEKTVSTTNTDKNPAAEFEFSSVLVKVKVWKRKENLEA